MNTIKRYRLPHSINTPLNVCITVENDFVLASEYDKVVAKNAMLEGCLAKLSCAYEALLDDAVRMLNELNKPTKGETK